MNKLKMLLIIILSCLTFDQLHAMVQPSPTTKTVTTDIKNFNAAKENTGDLAAVSDDNILEILLFCVEWDKKIEKECFKHINHIARTNRYLRDFIHTKLQESPSLKKLIFKLTVNTLIFKLTVEPKLHAYAQKKVNVYPRESFPNFNALHYAAFDWDIDFIKEIIPQLKRCGKADILNQVGTLYLKLENTILLNDPRVPMDFIINDTANKRPHHSDAEKYNLIALYLDAGAKPSLFAVRFAAEFTGGPRMHKTLGLLASKLSCEQISQYKKEYCHNQEYCANAQELHKKIEQYYLDLILKYHKCTQCTSTL